MNSMWTLSGLSWKDLAKRVWSETNEDDVLGRAAQLAYYFLLALFPLLIFLTAALGLILGSDSGVRTSLFNYLSQVMPGAAFQLVDTTMGEITGASGAGKLSFGLLATLWAASNGMGAITQALNISYDVTETRPWWKQRLVAITLTMAPGSTEGCGGSGPRGGCSCGRGSAVILDRFPSESVWTPTVIGTGGTDAF